MSEEKNIKIRPTAIIGQVLFWSVFLYGLIGFAVMARFPEVIKDGFEMAWTGRTPEVGQARK